METTPSPRWNATAKLVVSLTMIAAFVGLLIHFNTLVGPLLMAFIVAYLFYPAAGWITKRFNIPWRVSVALVYVVLIVLFLGAATASGFALVQQVQSLIALFDNTIDNLPAMLQEWSRQTWSFGPLNIDLRQMDLQAISEQALSAVQPVLSQTGEMVGAVAGGAFNVVSWTIFVFTISFFMLIESDGIGGFFTIDIPNYGGDIRRLGAKLAEIWNTFLRGQMIIFIVTTLVYIVVYSALGVRYALGLALLTGFSKFLPYVGQAINMLALVIVVFFQADHFFGLDPLMHAIVALAVYVAIDGLYDNLITTPLMARTLKVHPAAVLVALFVAADLLGFIGVIIAAPMLATLILLGTYISRKLFDLDPWTPEPSADPEPTLRERWQVWRETITRLFQKK
jgi:predicted PurR-regulated permease PerM